MRTILFSALIGLFLCTGAAFADADDSATQDATAALTSPAPVEADVQASTPSDPGITPDVEAWNPEPEWAFQIIRVPDYCPACQPCTSSPQCGRDPHNGSNLGVCSPPPNSWCPGTTTSVCICY